jgi:UDP-glucose 4-epimerase
VLVASSERIQAECGWRPERGLPAMVADAWQFSREQFAADQTVRRGGQ